MEHSPATVMAKLDEQLARGSAVPDRETWGMRTTDEAPAATGRGRRLSAEERAERARVIAQRTAQEA